MIKRIGRENIEECVNVIQESFLTVAKQFGFTKENAPRFTAFATNYARISQQYEEGRQMNAYFDADNKIIGYYSLHMQDNQECELSNLCVLPAYRHKRIGEELFQSAVETARARGCKKMNIGIVEENVLLKKWYEKQGANHIGTKKFDFFPFTCGYMKYDL